MKTTRRWKKIVPSLLAVLCLCAALTSCMVPEMVGRILSGQREGGDTAQTSSVPEVSQEEQPQSSQTPEQPQSAPEAGTKRVGAAGMGYVDIPSEWVRFYDVNGGTDLQFSDPDGVDIITMNQFDLSGLSAEEKAAFTAEDAALSVWSNIEQNDMVLEIEGAVVTLAGYEAYQVYASYSDGTFLCTWSLMDEMGTLYYVAAEGPAETVMDTVAMVEDSYSPHS